MEMRRAKGQLSMTIDGYLRTLETSFVPERAMGKRAILQYTFSGRDTGVCHAVIENGTIRVARGPHPAPTAAVSCDIDLWQRILAYDVDGLLAYQEGLYTVTGDVDLLLESDTWFRRV